MQNYQTLNKVQFPIFQGIMVNMMPIIVGDLSKLPKELHGYQQLIEQTRLEKGSLAYLTVRESVIQGQRSQGRGGIHVEAPKLNCWGGGNWGGCIDNKGIYMASNDGACNIWNEYIEDRDQFGACTPTTQPEKMLANTLYWLTDKTPAYKYL